jgi:hypothetical protein
MGPDKKPGIYLSISATLVDYHSTTTTTTSNAIVQVHNFHSHLPHP